MTVMRPNTGARTPLIHGYVTMSDCVATVETKPT